MTARKVLHGPLEISGQVGILCRGLREAGWKANGYNWFHTYLGYDSPIVQTESLEVVRVLGELFRYADIVHYHHCSSFLSGFTDIGIAKGMGKKVVMHHWGNDVRQVELANASLPHPLPPAYHTTAQIVAQLQALSGLVDAAIIQDRELIPHLSSYYANIHVLPLAIDTTRFVPAYPNPNAVKPVVVHAPTDTAFKGTALIEAAIAVLRGAFDFEYVRIERMSHKEALHQYMRADLVIDQVICGTYGMLSVEALALGKPVVAYIKDDVRAGLPVGFPIVQGHPDRLVEAIAPLLANARLRYETGVRSRSFAETYHDIRAVIPKLAAIYDSL